MHISSTNDYFYNKPNYSVKQNNNPLQTSPSFQAIKIVKSLRPILNEPVIPFAAPFVATGLGIITKNSKPIQEPVDYVKQIKNMTDEEFEERLSKLKKINPDIPSYIIKKRNILLAEKLCIDIGQDSLCPIVGHTYEFNITGRMAVYYTIKSSKRTGDKITNEELQLIDATDSWNGDIICKLYKKGMEPEKIKDFLNYCHLEFPYKDDNGNYFNIKPLEICLKICQNEQNLTAQQIVDITRSEVKQRILKLCEIAKNDIAYMLNSITDNELKIKFENRLKIIDALDNPNVKMEEYNKVKDLIDVYNNMHSNYSTLYNSKWQPYKYLDYYKFAKKNNPDILKSLTDTDPECSGKDFDTLIQDLRNAERNREWQKCKKIVTYCNLHDFSCDDFVLEEKFDSLVDYCAKYTDEFSEKYYNDYLKLAKIPEKLAQLCKDINEMFGVKVFLPKHVVSPQKQAEAEKGLNDIKKELMKWSKAGKEDFKAPPVIDLMITKKGYIDPFSAYGSSVSAGFCEDTAIYINGFEELVKRFIHELTHANDTKILLRFPDDFLVMGATKDAENQKFYDDFVQIGIPKCHIPYAYNNPREFIAVASEGDLSKATPEFKKQLIDFGMPEWRFDIQ